VPEANLPVFISHLLSRYALCVEYSQVLEEGFIFELAVLFSVMLLNAWIPRKGAKGWKPLEVSGSKCVVNCGRSTYKVSMCLDDCRLSTGM
jgi:hypothetical protein